MSNYVGRCERCREYGPLFAVTMLSGGSDNSHLSEPWLCRACAIRKLADSEAVAPAPEGSR